MDKIGDQLPAVAITAASLTLVFLGFLFASWEGYDATGKRAVRGKYRLRGWLAFAGFVTSLLSALCGFIAIGMGHTYAIVDCLGVVFLVAWAGLITAQSVIALRDIQ